MPITKLSCKARVVFSDQKEKSGGPQGHRDEYTPEGWGLGPAQELELMTLEVSSLHKVRI